MAKNLLRNALESTEMLLPKPAANKLKRFTVAIESE